MIFNRVASHKPDLNHFALLSELNKANGGTVNVIIYNNKKKKNTIIQRIFKFIFLF